MTDTRFNEGDEISRACARAGVIAGSELERDARRNVWGIAGSGMDGKDRDAKFDAWLGAQKKDPYYASCLLTPPEPKPKVQTKAEKKPIDPLNLSPDEFAEIAAGKVRVG